MTITNRQFTLLNAMNIPLWAAKNRTAIVKKQQEPAKNNSQASLNVDTLSQNKLFIDILLSMKLTITDVSLSNNSLMLGRFSWVFTDTDQVTFQQALLSTPHLKQLAKSLPLKKQLWEIIQKEIIMNSPSNPTNNSEQQP